MGYLRKVKSVNKNLQYNVNNQIIRQYKKAYPNANIYTRKFSKKFIKSLVDDIEKYSDIEYAEVFYEYNLFHANWYDIEGMGYGWIWTSYPEKHWRTAIGKCYIDALSTMAIPKDFKIIIVEDKDFIMVLLPTRTVFDGWYPCNRDIYLYLGKPVDSYSAFM